MLKIIALILINLPSIGPRVNEFDILEVNHYQTGSSELHQLIYWDWSHDYNRLHCQGWALLKDTKVITFNPPKFEVIKNGKIYIVCGHALRETFTNYDPEAVNRRIFRDRFRIKLIEK